MTSSEKLAKVTYRIFQFKLILLMLVYFQGKSEAREVLLMEVFIFKIIRSNGNHQELKLGKQVTLL